MRCVYYRPPFSRAGARMLKSRIVFAFVLIPFAIACQSTTTSTGLSDDGVPIDRCRSDLAAVYPSTVQFANSPPMSVDAHPDHYTRRNIAQEAGNSPEKIIY